MKLGDRVTFSRFYRRGTDYVDSERLTKEQEKELEETDQIILHRLVAVETQKPLSGIIAGKRKMVKSNTLGYGENRFNPETTTFGSQGGDYVDVYLVAVNMSGFYRVPEEWLQVNELPGLKVPLPFADEELSGVGY